MAKVSVIIPVYNSEKFICKCLDSVLAQTLQDIEVICVDDASEDNSYAILEKYTQQDDRVTLLRNDTNRGQSYARNRAIVCASGKYIQFVDSDDYIDPDLLEKSYCLSQEKELDILETECTMHTLHEKKITVRRQTPIDVITGIEYQNQYGINSFAIWKYFVRRSFLEKYKLNFYEGIIHEDVLFVYEMLKNAGRVFYIPFVQYHYMTMNSITTSLVDKNYSYYSLLHVVKKIISAPTDPQFMVSVLQRIQSMLSIYRRESCTYIRRENWEEEMIEIERMFLGEQHIDAALIYENRNRIHACQHKYIYGAGYAAGQLLEELDRYGIDINGFIVTKKEDKDVYMGHRITALADFNDNPKDCMILVAIASKGADAVISGLQGMGYSNIMYACRQEWREK